MADAVFPSLIELRIIEGLKQAIIKNKITSKKIFSSEIKFITLGWLKFNLQTNTLKIISEIIFCKQKYL